jgi:hypothetical protein
LTVKGSLDENVARARSTCPAPQFSAEPFPLMTLVQQ